ncbi:MAG: hypothetical protein COW78_15070 [Bdellovibrio sp. CG22_combo_CG10-13_8_21_14_all_39_27]|nr:MAG: hypothetical protein COW78_15070 [Bdellovibrio sp. CG22_combo_CG10-13_8_21_14_all_39_27]
MNINSDVLVSAIQKVMTNFEERFGDSLSLQDIADKTNSSYTTIREIKKGILKNLSVKKALEISKRLDGPKNLEELVKETKTADPNEAQELSRRFSHLFDFNMMPEKFDDLIANKDFSKILWAAFSVSHISRKEILYRWGKDGEDKLEYLLELGIVIEESGLIKGVAEKAGGDIKSAYKQLGIGYGLYNIANAEKEENWISLQTNSVNLTFVQEFREDLRALFAKFDEKSNSSKYAGNKRVLFGMIFDRYLEDIHEEDLNQ